MKNPLSLLLLAALSLILATYSARAGVSGSRTGAGISAPAGGLSGGVNC